MDLKKLFFGEEIETPNIEKKEIVKKTKKIKTEKIKVDMSWLEELNNNTNTNETYQIDDTQQYYLLEHKKLNKIFKIDIKIVDWIFKDFSKHWNNLSGEDILQKYKLKPEVFSLIKNKLRLYKSSHVVSPYTLENSTEEKEKEIIEEAINDSIDNYKDKFINTYDKQFKKEAKDAFKKVWNFEYQLNEFQTVLDNYKPKSFNFNSNTQIKINNNDSCDYIITDIHIWKKGTDRIYDDLSKILDSIKSRSEKNINIICLWDIWENFWQVPMHSGQNITMDRQDWFELMLEVADYFIYFLAEIKKTWKNVSFTWIAWNHDRLTSKNEDDIFRSAWLMIYELIKRWLSNTDININYFRENKEQTIFKTVLDNRNYILSHWEYWFNNKKAEDILWKYWRQDIFNIILSGHTHEHKQQIWYNFAKIVVAPLAWPGDYDERLWLKWEIWLTIIKNGVLGKIEITNIIL